MISGIVCIVCGIFLAGLSTPLYFFRTTFILGIALTVIGFILFVIGIILLITAKRRELNSFDERMEKKGYRYTKEYGDFLCNINRRIWWKRGVEIIYKIDDVVGLIIEHGIKDSVVLNGKKDKYKVIISTTNILAPVVEIDCGKSAVLAENIKSTIALLLESGTNAKGDDSNLDKIINTEYSDNIRG